MIQRSRFSIIFIFLFAVSLYGGQTGKIAGRVTDAANGNPLAGANIFLNELPLGAASDAEGDYIILNVAPGVYTLHALMVGYREVEITNVRVSLDKTTRIDFKLKPAILESETIVVEAEQPLIQKDLTASSSTVTATEIKTIPVESMQDVLQLQAGVVVDSRGGFHIRGGRANEVAYMIDGVSVSDPFNGGLAVNVNQEAIQELKVISGTFNAEYGKVMSGVVEVVTKNPEPVLNAGITMYTGDYFSDNIELYPHLDEHSPKDIYNVQIHVTGPIPFFKDRLSFYASLRKYYNEGWMYGIRRFNTSDSSVFTPNAFYYEETGDYAPVPMNFIDQYYANFKLIFKITPTLNLAYNFLGNMKDSRYYNHLYKYNPDGDLTNHEYGYTHILSVNHTLSAQTFYTLKFSRYAFDLRSYLYEDPDDPRYQNPELLRNREDAYSFLTGGTNMEHFYRNTAVTAGRFDITSQVTKRHLVKAGLEVKFNEIKVENREARYKGRESGIFSSAAFFNKGQYKHTPLELAAYVQDKIELQNLTVNVGLRYDYFDSKGKVPLDLRDPGNTYRPRENAYRDAQPQHQFSPRLGLAFPISAEGVIHASYGHFFQIPDLQYLYLNPRFAVAPGGLNTLMGNAELKPQSTTIYELGLQQEFMGQFALHITGFYKDVRNLLGTNIYETYVLGDRYARYENRDYGNIKGVTISFKKRATSSDYFYASIDYTFQIAEGNASDPNTVFYNNQADPPRQSNIQVVPLDWDQRHTLNASFSFNHPDWFTLGLIGQFQSGLPYTPAIQNLEATFENSGRKPFNYNVDLRFSKEWKPWGHSLIFFIKIYNLFDRQNEITVYNDTGRAGYSLVKHFLGNRQTVVNTLDDWLKRPDFYSEPRKILLGFTFTIR